MLADDRQHDCNISRLTPEDVASAMPALTSLVVDTVKSGAPIGFLPPLTDEDAVVQWQSVSDVLQTPHRILLAAWLDERLVGRSN